MKKSDFRSLEFSADNSELSLILSSSAIYLDQHRLERATVDDYNLVYAVGGEIIDASQTELDNHHDIKNRLRFYGLYVPDFRKRIVPPYETYSGVSFPDFVLSNNDNIIEGFYDVHQTINRIGKNMQTLVLEPHKIDIDELYRLTSFCCNLSRNTMHLDGPRINYLAA